jgi:hypothetical protein
MKMDRFVLTHSPLFMYLAENNLTGDFITETIAVITNMEMFNLFSNSLGGPLPPVVGAFTNLKALDLEMNMFTGPVVIADYVALSQLEQYLVGSNKLTGPLPGAIENWTKLRILSLAFNMIDGPLPPEIGSLTDLGTTWYIGPFCDPQVYVSRINMIH